MSENEKEAMQTVQENELREDILKVMHRHGISQARLARESGVTPARLNQWIAGKYKGNTAATAQELSIWLKSMLEREEQAASGCIPSSPSWMPTPTANRVLNARRYAQRMADISIVYGGAGLGKTLTARRYQEDNPNVWIATMTPSVISVTACLERVAYAVGVNGVPASASRAENAVISRVEGTGGLIVIDEAQHLPVTCLDALRSLYDASGVGLIFMGNESVYTQLTGGSRKAHFAQLFSRIGRRERLTAPALGDIDTLLDAWGVADAKARTLCHEIGTKAGALRGLTKVLRMAFLMLDEGENKVSALHIENAWSELGGLM